MSTVRNNKSNIAYLKTLTEKMGDWMKEAAGIINDLNASTSDADDLKTMREAQRFLFTVSRDASNAGCNLYPLIHTAEVQVRIQGGRVL